VSAYCLSLLSDANSRADEIDNPKTDSVEFPEERFSILKRVFDDMRNSLGHRSNNYNLELMTLGNFWSPNGLSVEQLKELFGLPDDETHREIRYRISSPYTSYIATFEIEDGTIRTREALYDIETNPISEETIFRIDQTYRNAVASRKLLKEMDRSQYLYSSFSLYNIFNLWKPDGLSVKEFIGIFDDPDIENTKEIAYRYDIPGETRMRKFRIEKGKVYLID